MISEQEQAQIRLLSDNELYPQAIAFMQSIGKALPVTQVNGLLNVSLANPYDHLKQFIEWQCARKTWGREQHIPDFYKKLTRKLIDLEAYAPSILKLRAERASIEDEMAIKMALAHDFIQHILAENAYRSATRDFAPTSSKDQDKLHKIEG